MSAREFVGLAAVLLLVVPLAGTAQAEHSTTQVINPSDGADYDSFGAAMALDGDTLVVGAMNKHSASGVGGAYVFARHGGQWVESQMLEPGVVTNNYARAVAVHGETALVSGTPSPWGPLAPGVFLFELANGTWAEEAFLQPEAQSDFSHFGRSVAIADGLAVVGAPYDSSAAADAGAVYLFEKIAGNWTQVDRLVASDAAPDDGFGWAVAASVNRVLVGAPWDDDAGSFAGAMYVFDRTASGWSETAKITPQDANEWQDFGETFVVVGSTLAVGVRTDDQYRGAVYLFADKRGNWVQQQKITMPGTESGDQFGNSLSLTEDMLLVGERSDGVGYVFRRAPVDFALVETLLPTIETRDSSAAKVAVWRGDALVSAPGIGSGSILHYDVAADPTWPCTIVGSSGADYLVGTDGDDVICGRGGDDHLYGKKGDDVLKGGAGDDWLYAGYGFDFLSGNAGDDRLIGGAQGDLMLGGPGDDVLRGKGGHDYLEGNTGHDRLFGAIGNDVLLGGEGIDECHGGLGVNSFGSCEG